MRATFFGIEIGKRAILTQRTALDVTSHNIANANTEGYSRQRAVLAATDSWSVPGFFAPVTAQQVGTGVDVKTIENFRNAFIDEKIAREKSTLEYRTAADDLMKEIEAIFNEPNEATFRHQLDKFWASWEDLSINPASAELRRNVQENAVNLVSMLKDIDLRLRRLQGTSDHVFQGSIENKISDSLKQINNLAAQIATLNSEIERLELANARANDLRDKRQKLIEDLSKLLNIESYFDSKGHLSIRTGEFVLVEHDRFHTLNYVKKYAGDPGTLSYDNDYPEFSDKPSVATAVLTHTAQQRNVTITVKSVARAHSMYSFLTFHPLNGPLANFGVSNGTFRINNREFYIDAEKTTMNDLVKMINEANVQVKAWLNQSGQLELTSVLTGVENAISIVNGTSNLVTVLNLQESQKAQNAVFSIGNKQFVSQFNEVENALPGVKIFINGVGVANLDLRSPVNNGKMQALFEIRDGVIKTVRDKLDEFAYRLVTEVNYVHRKGFGLDGVTGRNFFVALQSDNPSKPYKDAIKKLAIEEFILADVNTIAAAGGTILNPHDKLPTYNGPGDGSNAILIAQVKHGLFFNGGKANFNDYYNEIVTQIAVQSNRYETERKSSDDLLNQLIAKREEISGVSLDEELTNLIKFQHAYNAAAKIVTTVDSLLDKIINGMLR